jgi:hypothetical protein
VPCLALQSCLTHVVSPLHTLLLAPSLTWISCPLATDLELRDREIQTLKASLKKATEEVESGVGAAKTQSSSQLAKKASDIKALQRRTEVAKTEADQAKAQSKAYKASLEKVRTLRLSDPLIGSASAPVFSPDPSHPLSPPPRSPLRPRPTSPRARRRSRP